MQHAEVVAAGHRIGGSLGRGTGFVVPHEAEAVERVVDLGDAIESVTDKFHRREFAACDPLSLFTRGKVGKVKIGHP